MKIKEAKRNIVEQIESLTISLAEIQNRNETDDLVNISSPMSFYNIISAFSTQKRTPLSDKYIIKNLGMRPSTMEEDCGDAVDSEGKYYELKTSFSNEKKCLNIRQLRPWQPVDYYYCFFIDTNNFNNSVFFKLSKEQMKNEINSVGTPTHGSRKANSLNINIEYSITLPVFDNKNENVIRWKNNYKIEGKDVFR